MPIQEPIRMMGVRTKIVERRIKDSYALNTSKKWVWLQRICFWILDKLGAYAFIEHEAHSVVTWRTEDLYTLVRDGMFQLHSVGLDAKHILVGREEYFKLTQQTPCSAMGPMWFPIGGGPVHPSIHNANIVVVPWMNGVLVLPDLDKI